MKIKYGCEAYQVSDQMTCTQCSLTWDMNDQDPPECHPRGDMEAQPDGSVHFEEYPAEFAKLDQEFADFQSKMKKPFEIKSEFRTKNDQDEINRRGLNQLKNSLHKIGERS